MRKVRRLLLVAIALAVGAVLLGIVPINAGFIRGPLAEAARDATGLELSIQDRIVLRLGPTPSVSSGDLVYGDRAGDPLLVIESLRAKIGLFALMGGRIHVHEVKADGIQVDYCSPLPDLQGDSNEDTSKPSIAVDSVEIGRITVRCGPAAQADPFQINIARVLATAPAGAPIQLNVEGGVSSIDFTLNATGGTLDQLIARTDRFTLSALLESATASAEISGHLSPMAEAVDAQLNVHVGDTQLLSEAFGMSVPAIGALHAEARVRSDFETLDLLDVFGELGRTRFAFDATLDPSGERPRVGLTATLAQLDLAPFMADEPATGSPDEAANLGDIDLGTTIDMLSALDTELLVTVSRVLGAPVDLGDVELEASGANGMIELHSLEAKLLGGSISMAGSFDSQSDCPELHLNARGREFDITTSDEGFGGRVGTLNLETHSCGDSLFSHRDSLRARAELAGGRASLDGEQLPLAANRVELSIGPGNRSRVSLTGELAGERVQATITAGSLQEFLSPETWPIDIEAHAAGSRFQLGGRASIVTGQPILDAVAKFEAPHIGTLSTWGAVSSDSTLPLTMTARLQLDESRLIADAMALALGQSDVSGRLVWNHAQNPDILALTLRSSYLDLDEISEILPPTSEPPAQTHASNSDRKTRPVPTLAALPRVDLDLMFDALQFNQLDLQELSISGRLRAGLIDEARFGVLVEKELQLRGALDLDLRHLPAKGELNATAENADFGLLLARMDVAEDLRLRADGLELLVTIEGETLGQLLPNALLEAEIRGLQWRIPRDDSGQTYDLSLTQLGLTAARDQPTIWTSSGDLDGLQLEIWIEMPSLTDAYGETTELPLTLVAAADSDVVMLEARVDRSSAESLAASVLLSGQVLESENRSLAGLVSPLADYELRGDIILTEDKLELLALQMRLGTSTANGSILVADVGDRRRVDIALHGPYLQTDDLLYWTGGTHDEIVAGDSSINEADDSAFLMARNFLKEFRKTNDLGIDVTIGELRAGTDLLGGAELRLYIDENDFTLKPLNFSLPGGGVNAEYTARVRDGRLDAGLKVQAEALLYGGLLHLADRESEATGLLYLDTSISASTEWSPDAVPFDLLLKNADGFLDIAAWPENVEAGLLDLWTANLVLALLPLPTAGVPSKLNCIAARLEVKDGEMKTKNTLLDSTDTIIRGRGTIDLAQEQLDLLVVPQAKLEKFLSASTPVRVTGSFDDYRIGVEPAGFVGTMMKWYTGLIYVPFKWLTGRRFPPDGTPTCFDAMDWELTPELHDYFLQGDFSSLPPVP